MTKSSKSKNRFAAFLLLKSGGKMIRIRSPTKKKLNSKSISDWKSNTSGRGFFLKRKGEIFNEARND